jgi:DNA repair exonuclease SbcCD ATPase subunit
MNNTIDLYNNENYIRVYWEDTLDNYTKSNEKRIEKYFENKYKTNKVKVVFKAIPNKNAQVDVNMTADASELILDANYQAILVDKYLEENGLGDINKTFLNKLDTTVNAELGDFKDMSNRYKSFKILSVEFSNFLSYGEGNIINIDKPGITSIISKPANFSGKSTLTVDLLSFLFFGVTSKTDKYEEIFNKYSDKDMVVVKGTIQIEGDTYIIKRILTRKQTKSKGYKCEQDLDFFQLLPKGGTKQLNGEERRHTDFLIKEYIGSYDDFLITILTTGDNLDDLIKTKPTERGRLLTRFIGLEFYREKEKVAKKLYSDWKEKSNLYHSNVAEITTKIETENGRVGQNKSMNVFNGATLKAVEENIKNIETLRETLTGKRINNVDVELYKINENVIVDGIEKLKKNISDKTDILSKMSDDIVEPKEAFDLDTYQALNVECRGYETEVLAKEFEIRNNNNTISMLKDSELCQTCMRPLEGVDNTEKINNLKTQITNLETDIKTINVKILNIKTRISSYDSLKKEWDEYNKNELILSRHKLEITTLNDSLKRGEDKLNTYRQNIQNIENNKKIDTELEVLKNKLSNANTERDGLLLQIRSCEKEIEMSERLITGYNTLLKELAKEEIIDKIYKTYIDIYGKNGISKMILGTMIPLINSYLHMLLIDTAEFILELRMDDKGDVNFWMVDSVNGVEKPLAAGSGYEKTVSSLALRCVLRKVCSLPKPNIIIFDEITGKVANENLDKLGLFFDKIKLYFEHIWLISHNPLVQDWADNTIRVIKENNISRIANEND